MKKAVAIRIGNFAIAFDALCSAIKSAPDPPDCKEADQTVAERDYTKWFDGPRKRAMESMMTNHTRRAKP